MAYKRVLAVGDIHGEWEKFISLYEKIQFNPEEDFLIFLGDYIDRGPDSLRVLEWLYRHQRVENMVMLRGNHEQMMLDYYCGSKDGGIWLWNGGDKTLEILKEQPHELLEEYLQFIKQMPIYHQMEINGKAYIFCHAGLRPDVPLTEQTERDMLWIREEFFEVYEGEPIIVVGHTPVCFLGNDTAPIHVKGRNIIMADTGSFLPDGYVSCIDVMSGACWQSDSALNDEDKWRNVKKEP